MKTIQMTLDEKLLGELDKMVRSLKTTRSAFARRALKLALAQAEQEKLEARHKKGYEQFPVEKFEFSVWEDQQDWGDE